MRRLSCSTGGAAARRLRVRTRHVHRVATVPEYRARGHSFLERLTTDTLQRRQPERRRLDAEARRADTDHVEAALVRAAVCREFGAPLRIEDVELRPPGPNEVTVGVHACAICRSDISFVGGDWGGALPAVYGHEAAGVVERTGRGVDGLHAGDRVAVTLIRSCGACELCRRGEPALCEGSFPSSESETLRGASGPVHQGMRIAAFADMVTVDASQAVRLPAEMPLDRACLLSCGVLTGIGAVVNTARVAPHTSVVVIGTGGVGLNCVQGARLAGADVIVAVDPCERKRDAAVRFGATHSVDPAHEDVQAVVGDAAGGHRADYVFVSVGVARAIEDGFALLRRGGTLVVVGITPVGAAVTFDPVAIADGSLRILGSKMGSSQPHTDIPRLCRAYLDGGLKLDELISGRFPLEQINEAMASAGRGEQLRPVIVFDGARAHEPGGGLDPQDDAG
jgi:S-(hydroxymethyl)glutathione dehydrogenase / alcohol dehydrogenase